MQRPSAGDNKKIVGSWFSTNAEWGVRHLLDAKDGKIERAVRKKSFTEDVQFLTFTCLILKGFGVE